MEPLGLAKPFNAMEYYAERDKEHSTMKHEFSRGVSKKLAEKEHYAGTAQQKANMQQNVSQRKYDAIKAHPSQHATFPYKGNK